MSLKILLTNKEGSLIQSNFNIVVTLILVYDKTTEARRGSVFAESNL